MLIQKVVPDQYEQNILTEEGCIAAVRHGSPPWKHKTLSQLITDERKWAGIFFWHYCKSVSGHSTRTMKIIHSISQHNIRIWSRRWWWWVVSSAIDLYVVRRLHWQRAIEEVYIVLGRQIWTVLMYLGKGSGKFFFEKKGSGKICMCQTVEWPKGASIP